MPEIFAECHIKMYTGSKLVHFSVWQKSGQVFIVHPSLFTVLITAYIIKNTTSYITNNHCREEILNTEEES
jgi:hypothetical protein